MDDWSTCDWVSFATVAAGALLIVSEALGFSKKTDANSITEIVLKSAKALTSPRHTPQQTLTQDAFVPPPPPAPAPANNGVQPSYGTANQRGTGAGSGSGATF